MIQWSIKNGGLSMWQKKEKNDRETISIEEYLVRRKRKNREENPDRRSFIQPENRTWILAQLYMQA